MSADKDGKQQDGQDFTGSYEENAAEQQDSDAQTAAQPGSADGVDDLAEQIQEAVTAALAEQRDSVLRAQAEVQNMRRRCEADLEKAHKFALERFSGDLLSVVDNLERALAAVPPEQAEQVKSLSEGVELTLKGFLEVFAKFKIEQLAPQGEPFDPQLHQAVASIPNANVEPNTVIEVMQKGYSLNGRVIRPAMVVVAKSS